MEYPHSGPDWAIGFSAAIFSLGLIVAVAFLFNFPVMPFVGVWALCWIAAAIIAAVG